MRDKILAMEPGKLLDSLIAEDIMKVNPEAFEFAYEAGNFNYSTDISAAWQVLQNMKARLFSKRGLFLKNLQDVVSFEAKGLKTGDVIAYPDVIWFLTPETICKAALLAVMKT